MIAVAVLIVPQCQQDGGARTIAQRSHTTITTITSSFPRLLDSELQEIISFFFFFFFSLDLSFVLQIEGVEERVRSLPLLLIHPT